MDTRSKTGLVFVEKGDKLDEMLHEEPQVYSRNSTASRTGRRVRKIVTHQEEEKKEDINKSKAREVLQQTYAKTEAETQKNIERSIQRNIDQKNQRFHDLNRDIDKCQDFLDIVDKNISLHEEAERNKVKRQFGEWNTQVHSRIQEKISNQLNAVEYKTMLKTKNDDYQKFLDITNKKSAIFRDIIIESEYDPLEPNRRAIKAKPGKLKDPTLHILQKTIDEHVMLDPEYLKTKSNTGGKYTLPTEMWAAGKIEATPHGRFGKMMACAGDEDKRKRAPKSNVVFDEYTFPKGKAITDSEMPKGKRPLVTGGLSSFNPIKHCE